MTGPSRKLAIASQRLDESRLTPGIVHPGSPRPTRSEHLDDQDGVARLAEIARREYAARRRRDKLFNADIFAEPAWDMLLDLFVQRHHLRPVSVHSLCIAAAVPQTTALRWIGKLARIGLLERQNCTYDNRVVLITLSETGLDVMQRYLTSQLGESGAAPVRSEAPGNGRHLDCDGD